MGLDRNRKIGVIMAIWYNASTNSFYDDEIVAPPPTAIEITAALRDSLIAQQSAGKVIQADANGQPISTSTAPRVLTIEQQILALEATMTPRRIREAANGTDNGWMKNLDAQITALRAQLPR